MTPRLPRHVSGDRLAAALQVYGYEVRRRTGSHIRLTTNRNGEHHITIPAHASLRIGTLSGVLAEVSRHLGISKHDLTRTLLS